MGNRKGATGTVAQLGERRTEDAEAAGSSPASPTKLSLYVARVILHKQLIKAIEHKIT